MTICLSLNIHDDGRWWCYWGGAAIFIWQNVCSIKSQPGVWAANSDIHRTFHPHSLSVHRFSFLSSSSWPMSTVARYHAWNPISLLSCLPVPTIQLLLYPSALLSFPSFFFTLSPFFSPFFPQFPSSLSNHPHPHFAFSVCTESYPFSPQQHQNSWAER